MNKRIIDQINRPWREQAEKAIEERDAEGILFCVGDNLKQLPLVFDCFSEFHELGILEAAFASAFTASRINNANISMSMLRFAISLMDREKLRLQGDQLTGPGPFVVYRGVAGKGARRRVKGLSWTGKPEMAAWFAYRYMEHGLEDPAVFRAEVERDQVLWFTNARKEQEYVLLLPDSYKPKRLKFSIEEIKAMSERVNAKRQEEWQAQLKELKESSAL